MLKIQNIYYKNIFFEILAFQLNGKYSLVSLYVWERVTKSHFSCEQNWYFVFVNWNQHLLINKPLQKIEIKTYT